MKGIRIAGLVALMITCLLGLGCSREVKIGAVISETGAAAIYGEKVRKGMDLAVEEINAAGGFDGRPFTVLYEDDQTRAEVGLQAVERLVEEQGVKVVIGAVSSRVTLKIAPYCQEKEIILLSPTASAPKISEMGDYVYRNYPSDILEGTSMADFARDLGLERMVVFSATNEFGHGLQQVFSEEYPSKYRRILETFEFEEENFDSFDPLVEQTAELDPDGIYIAAYVGDFAELLKRIRAAGIEAVVLGNASVTDEIVTLAGEAAENLVYPQPTFDPESDDPAMRAFVEAYRAKYGTVPDRFAAHGYDAVKLLLKAMEDTSSSHPDNIKIGLANVDNYHGASGRISFDKNGDVVQYPRLYIIRQGRPVPYEQFIEEGGTLTVPRS